MKKREFFHALSCFFGGPQRFPADSATASADQQGIPADSDLLWQISRGVRLPLICRNPPCFSGLDMKSRSCPLIKGFRGCIFPGNDRDLMMKLPGNASRQASKKYPDLQIPRKTSQSGLSGQIMKVGNKLVICKSRSGSSYREI
ncbi:MAG: hypothetical protein K6E83_04725 [Clostridium sp.]|nr:hypothetical protein [Clostridium sp.]